MHPLLHRQLKRLGLHETACPADTRTWQALLARISQSYQEGEQGRALLERSLDVTSREMQGLYEALRRSSETELAQERNKLEAVLHSLGDGLCVVDADWRIQLVNAEAERLFCVNLEHLRGRPIYQMLSPGPEEHETECLITDASFPPLQRGEPYRTNDGVLVQADGQLLPVSLVVTPVVTDHGVVGAVLVFRDISAEKAAQEQQALTEALLRRIQAGLRKLATDPTIFNGHLEAAFAIITQIAAQTLNVERTSIWFFSPTRARIRCAAWHQLHPRQSQDFDLSGASFPRYFAELQTERVIDADDCQSDPRTSELSEAYLKPLGINSILVVPVRAEANLIGVVCHEHIGPRRRWTMEEQQFAASVANTVSLALEAADRQKAEQALRHVSTLQKAILDNAGHAIISTTPEGIIQTFNPAAEQLLGYGASEVIGRQTPLVFHDAEEITARAQRFSEELGVPLDPGFEVFVVKTRQNQVNEHEWTYVRKDGTRLTVLLSITALWGTDGHIVGFLGIASDITQRKIVERQLLTAKEAAEAANVAKSQFLANMSHEIRTPMNGVLGMTELLLAGGLKENHLRLAQTIYRSATSLLGIVNDILDFSKIEAGKLVLDHVEFDLPQLVEELGHSFGEPAQRKHLELICKVHPSVPHLVSGDPVRLRQILSNLLGNAIKFTQTGELIVEVDTIGHGADQVVCLFSVSDTGVGIPSDVHESIFEPFAQADGSTTRRYGGTGLGLTIVKQLITLMDGELGVESLPGKGSTFWFTVRLPLVSAGRGMKTGPLFVQPVSILVVDDNASQRIWLDHLLTTQGACCKTTESGTQALTLLRDAAKAGTPFDMVLIDLYMPDLNGIQTIEALAAIPRLPRPKILLMTPIGLHAVPETPIPVSAILTKPLSTSTLMPTVLKALTEGPSSASAFEEPSAQPHRLVGVSSLHALLAEDNQVNREVAIGMLSALGCSVDAVDTGHAAVEQSAAQSYDIILMDCQMPVMDGYDATRLIREREREQSTPVHIPIIALTANALPGDRERCLAAGMDDYVSKPFSLKDLEAVLARSVSRTTPAPFSSGLPQPVSAMPLDEMQHPTGIHQPDQPLINPEAWHIIAQLQRPGQPDLLAKLLRLYLKDSRDMVDKIDGAVKQRHATLLRESAHSLKSRSATLGAQRLADLCQHLEQAGRMGAFEQMDRLAEQLHRTFTDTCARFDQELGKRAA